VSACSPDRIGLRIEGQGRPIVLLHSSMSSRHQWRELITDLKASYRLIAIDLLGYGDSALRCSASNYSLAAEVAHVEAVLERELGRDEPFHLVGHSYGGAVALQLAQRTRAISSLTLFEPMALHLLALEHCARGELRAVAGAMTRLIDAGQTLPAAEVFVDYWSGEGTFAAMPELKREHLRRLVPKVLLEFDAINRETLRAADVQRITAPTCLITGRSSPLPARLLSARLSYLLQNASSFEVAAGHMAPITHPELVNPLISQFIGAVDFSAPVKPARSVSRPPLLQRLGRLAASAPVRSRALPPALLAALCAGFIAARAPARAYDGDLDPEIGVYPLEKEAWHATPGKFLSSARYAVVSGNADAAGPYVLRVNLPAGTRIEPVRPEHEIQLVVLSGEIALGHGANFSPGSTRLLKPGNYVLLGAQVPYYAFTRYGATVQVFGTGPLARAPAHEQP
jgi:pimeloyl-ACP methyl ester carboxylesterase